MYKSFFGLQENPFNVSPDPRYMFLTKEIGEALSGLMYGIQTRKGFITLTGEVGTGKTTLVNRLLDWLHLKRTKTAFLFNSRMNSSQLFDFILAEFDIHCDNRSKSQQLMKLNQWLMDRYKAGETAVLIVDEAQNLTFPVLEEIRLLTNFETSTHKLLQIVLSGQPELEEKLKLPQLRQLRQRITIRSKTSSLTKAQTHSYIQERLRIAGAVSNEEPIFSAQAIDTVHVSSSWTRLSRSHRRRASGTAQRCSVQRCSYRTWARLCHAFEWTRRQPRSAIRSDSEGGESVRVWWVKNAQIKAASDRIYPGKGIRKPPIKWW